MHPHPGTPKQRRRRNLAGPKLKGQPKLDRSPKATNLFTFPEQDSRSLTRYQKQEQHTFEKTAGWRGPWAAPLLWRVCLGDLGTEEPKIPHQGNRPGKRNSIQDSRTHLKWSPESVLPLSPLFYQTTRGTKNRQDWTITQYLTILQTRSARSQTVSQTRERARVVSRAAAGRRADTGPNRYAPRSVLISQLKCQIAIASITKSHRIARRISWYSLYPPKSLCLHPLLSTGHETEDGHTGLGTTADEGWGLLGKTYRLMAVKVEAKEEHASTSLPVASAGDTSLPVSSTGNKPSPEEVGTKEEEAGASSLLQETHQHMLKQTMYWH